MEKTTHVMYITPYSVFQYRYIPYSKLSAQSPEFRLHGVCQWICARCFNPHNGLNEQMWFSINRYTRSHVICFLCNYRSHFIFQTVSFCIGWTTLIDIYNLVKIKVKILHRFGEVISSVHHRSSTEQMHSEHVGIFTVSTCASDHLLRLGSTANPAVHGSNSSQCFKASGTLSFCDTTLVLHFECGFCYWWLL